MKNILFCLPGRSYSGRFLTCWTNLLVHCVKMGYKINVIQRYSCNLYYVRNMCLGTDVRRGENQKPFDGKLDYDYMMWIDSDVVFTPEQFERLLSHDKDIVSGLYKMENNTHYACVEHWNESEFLKNGHFQFIKPSDIEYRTHKLIDVNYVGFGFIRFTNGDQKTTQDCRFISKRPPQGWIYHVSILHLSSILPQSGECGCAHSTHKEELAE